MQSEVARSTHDYIRRPTRRVRWGRADWVVVSLITVAGGLLRLLRLTTPNRQTGDESFYAVDACWYVYASEAKCDVPHEMNLEHPPLGKWIIGWGERIFGYETFGFRIGAALLGTLTILLLYLLARRLFASTLAASVTSGLLAFDFLHFVHSRVAMLDVFLLFFAVASFLLLIVDRDKLFAIFATAARRDRRWRYAAGAAAGLALASKWSGIFVLITIAFLSVVWDVQVRRRQQERHPVLSSIREEGTGWIVAFFVVPVLFYVVTFIGRIDGALFSWPWNQGSWWNALWDRQVHTFRFHAELVWSHRFSSAPWNWPVAKRGVPFTFRTVEELRLFVVSTGNPVVWVASLLAVVYAALRWLPTRRPERPEGFIVAGFLWAFLPWVVYYVAPYLFFTWGRAGMFIWYLLPALPFMYLAMGYAALSLARRFAGRIALGVFSAFVIGAFAFYYPILAYVPLTEDAFRARVFAFDDCRSPDAPPLIYFESSVENGTTRFEERHVPPSRFIPPPGWCWL